jgi:hypothetical protein
MDLVFDFESSLEEVDKGNIGLKQKTPHLVHPAFIGHLKNVFGTYEQFIYRH